MQSDHSVGERKGPTVVRISPVLFCVSCPIFSWLTMPRLHCVVYHHDASKLKKVIWFKPPKAAGASVFCFYKMSYKCPISIVLDICANIKANWLLFQREQFVKWTKKSMVHTGSECTWSKKAPSYFFHPCIEIFVCKKVNISLLTNKNSYWMVNDVTSKLCIIVFLCKKKNWSQMTEQSFKFLRYS